jgi:hypothetical protein
MMVLGLVSSVIEPVSLGSKLATGAVYWAVSFLLVDKQCLIAVQARMEKKRLKSLQLQTDMNVKQQQEDMAGQGPRGLP